MEIGEVHQLASQVWEREGGRWLTHLQPCKRLRCCWNVPTTQAITIHSSRRECSQHGQTDGSGNERTNGVCSLSQWASNPAIRAHKHRTRGAMSLVGLGHFAIALQQHMDDPLFGYLEAIRLRSSPADEDERQFACILALPPANFGQERRSSRHLSSQGAQVRLYHANLPAPDFY